MTDAGPALLCDDGSGRSAGAMGRAATLLRSRHAVVLDLARRRGPIGRTIVEAARDCRASVIVLGSHASAVLRHSGVPVLSAGAAMASPGSSEPVLIGYDGSGVARQALATAADLLTGRLAIVAAFLPSLDDTVVLRSALPWPVAGEAEDRLARADRQEAEGPAERAAEGARAAATAGFHARALGLPAAEASTAEEQEPWRRLLRAAADVDAACIVVGHRPSVNDAGSTAHGLVRHADRPVLVLPADGV